MLSRDYLKCRTENPRVGGSIPPLGTIFFALYGFGAATFASMAKLRAIGRGVEPGCVAGLFIPV
jgi:hypothetical protein